MALLKHTLDRIAWALMAALVLGAAAPPAQTSVLAEGSIGGRISAPAVKAKKRISRAALYRSRLAAKEKDAAPRPAPTLVPSSRVTLRRRRAVAAAPCTKRSAPHTRSTRPAITRRRLTSIGYCRRNGRL